MISKKKQRAAMHACGIALAALSFVAHAEPDAAAPATLATEAPAAQAPAEPVAASAPALPQTRVLFKLGVYKPGIEKLRVVRREDTVGHAAGQVALNVAFAVLAGGMAAQGFSKDDLGGTTLAALEQDPLGVNPAISDLTDALGKVATGIYRKRAEAAHALALTDGSTPEEIAEAAKVQAQADTPLLPGPWHLVYENLLGSDELFRLKFGAQLGRAGFMRPPAECFYQSEPVAWAQWQADNWQRLREERAKAVAACTAALAATPEKFW
ncbi:hypothetical protein [Variovorax sp. OK605]|uniref:hypothetical protein n=1 Tax=Variovorax sp. OK605 TaxID=1855317 RepID=UPI00210AC32F|nr:hypothetical protein [Variovorax sp. OK605]